MVDAGAPDREPLKPSDWTTLGDDKLLEIRMCDLGLRIEGTELEARIAVVSGELEARGVRFRPHYWLMRIPLRGLGWTLIALVLGCRTNGRVAAEAGPPRPGSASTAAPVVRKASVVVFWLTASDTLEASDGADLLDDFRYYTRATTP